MRNLPYEIILTRKDGTTRTFVIRQCGRADLDAILALQEKVYAGVEDKDTFALTSREQFAEMLEYDRIYCAELTDGDAPVMAGLTAMTVNRVCGYHAGKELGYVDERFLTSVCMDVSFIDASCRGFGIQQVFFGLREEAARELGAAEALTTISPDNEYSLANALRAGYTVVKQTAMYGGLDRYILRKVFE